MSSQVTGVGTSSDGEFGANEWLVAEMYDQFAKDRNSVDQAWWPVLEAYEKTQRDAGTAPAPAGQPQAPSAAQPAASAPAAPAPAATPASEARPLTAPIPVVGGPQPVARTTARPAAPQPVPAQAPKDEPAQTAAREDVVTPLRGMPKTLAANMDESLTVPTATSVRTVPAKLMIDNRIVINNHMSRTRGGKVSFTHLIGWALIQALKVFPSQNVSYAEIDGKPSVVAPAHINLGIAIDLPKPDGTRALMVPSIKQAESLTFSEYLSAYEDLVKRARGNKLTAADFQGTTISLTNPGGIGTVHSVPRLMKGQGCIVGAGALEYPAEFQGSSEKTLVELAIGKTITLTSTYDHRVIQGAGSGEFLKIVHELLIGQRGFYEEIFAALRIPYAPIHWSSDINVDLAERVDKQSRVVELINSYRVRGHLMADIDPLEYVQRTHPDLEIENHGLTFWDLDREFVTGGFGGRRTMKLRDILGVLRDSYCRTIGVEYMHIQDPTQRKWFQDNVEVKYQKPSHDEQLRILDKLNQAEAFETFLQTKYVGQKRFSLEGGESLIPLLDQILRSGRRGPGRRRDRHGPPRPPERADQHRRQGLQPDLPRVRGVRRDRVEVGLRRRQVPPRHRGHLRVGCRGGTARVPGGQPVAPGDGGRRAGGHRPGGARPDADRHVLLAADLSTAMPRSRFRAWWWTLQISCADTAPAAPCTSSSTTRSASRPCRRTAARRCTPPMSPRPSRPPSSTSTAMTPRPSSASRNWPSPTASSSIATSSSTSSATAAAVTTRATTRR